ncbi:transglycosylase SLT domain-containing protein [Streptomyces sp. NPDC126497]|uniref:transglycosylase SLT domain-containing protein n=1 Tax=Streptomyces sp. NPDC126497 TaxID=3155313 RepID=UPI0033203091
MPGTLLGTGFVRVDADTSPAMKALQSLGSLGASALQTSILPVTAAVTAGVGALTASLASAGAAGGAFAAAVIPQFQKITEAGEKLESAEEAQGKATIAKAHAQKLARDLGVKYGRQIEITSKMSAGAKEKAQEYNRALSGVTTATEAARKSQAIYDEKMAAMTPATRKTARAFEGLKDDIDKWSDSLSSTTMPLFTAGIEKLRDVLPRLTPFVRIAAREIKEFTSSLGEGQAGRVFREFGQNLQGNAGSALGNFLTSIKNITVGVVGMVNAFMPAQSEVSGGLVELTQRFADFGAGLGESEGFATFMERARDAVPAIKEFASALGDIASAAGPMGGFGLLMLQLFAQIVAAVPTPVLRMLVPAILAVNAGMKLYAVYQAAATAATWAFRTSVVTSTGAIATSRAALLLFRIQWAASAVATGAATAATWAWTTATRIATVTMRAARVAALFTAGAMRALAVAMVSNPIGIVITLLVALGAVFVVLWKRSETFRNVVKGALGGVADAARAVGAWFAGPFVDFFTGAWDWLRDKVFSPIGRFFTQVLPGAAEALRTKVEMAWRTMVASVLAVWLGLKDRVLSPIGGFFTKTVPGWAAGLRDRVVGAWTGMRDRLANTYGSIRNRVFSPIGGFFTKTIPGWAGTVRSRVVGHFNGMRDRLADAYGSIRSRVFSPIGRFFTSTIPGWARTLRDKVQGYFRQMRDGIGTIWSGIRSKTKAPVNWVLDHIWNRGLVKVWGKITNWVGLDNKLKAVKLLAAGGTVGRAQPGVFNRPTAIVGEGNPRYPEYVIPTDPKYAVRARGLWEAAGAHFYADGGILGDVKNLGGKVVGGVKGAVTGIADFLSDPVGKAKKMLLGTLSSIGRLGSSPWVRMVARLPRMAVNGLVDTVREAAEGLIGGEVTGHFGAIPGRGVQRWAGVVRQALGLVGQPQSLVQTTLRRMNQESGGNPRAVNKWDINWQRGHPSVGLMQVIRPTFQSHAGRFRKTGPFLYGTSINPLANVYASMRYALATYGSLSRAYNRPGGYALGTDGSSAGWHWTGEMGPELMKLPAGTRIRSHRASMRQAASPAGGGGVVHLTVENHGVIASRREAEDWLVASLDQLRRRNRLPRALGGNA